MTHPPSIKTRCAAFTATSTHLTAPNPSSKEPKNHASAPAIGNQMNRRNKYGAKKTVCIGETFDSKLEAAVYWDLKLREKAGNIKALKRQVSIQMTDARILMRPDFSYVDAKSGETIYMEVKGFETEGYKLKKRLWKHYGPGILEIIKGRVDHNGFGRYTIAEVIVPARVDDSGPKKVS